MRGSDKQIAWAEEIKGCVLEVIRTAEINIDLDFASGHDIARKNFEVIRRVVESIDYAGTVIDAFRNIRDDDYQVAMGSIAAAIRADRDLRRIAEKITVEVFGQQN